MQRNRQKETVAVLFGGRSAEHEVSVITGHQVMDALEAAGYTLLPIYITKEGAWYAGQSLHNIHQYTHPSFSVDRLQHVYRVSLSPDTTIRQLLPHPDRGRRLFQNCYKAPAEFPARACTSWLCTGPSRQAGRSCIGIQARGDSRAGCS